MCEWRDGSEQRWRDRGGTQIFSQVTQTDARQSKRRKDIRLAMLHPVHNGRLRDGEGGGGVSGERR